MAANGVDRFHPVSSIARTQFTDLRGGFFASSTESAMRLPRRPVAFDAIDGVAVVAQFIPFLALVMPGTVAMRVGLVITRHIDSDKRFDDDELQGSGREVHCRSVGSSPAGGKAPKSV